jgi:large subunit ribosomal protein L13
MPRQTTFAKPGELEARWYHVDADGEVLGRLASRLAVVLQGKHRPEFTPHIDTGEFVVVTNAEKIVMTGRKAEQRFRLDYSRYPSGLRRRSYATMLETRPESVIERAVQRMLPKGRLGRKMARKLKVYRGSEHPHQAQRPAPLPV